VNDPLGEAAAAIWASSGDQGGSSVESAAPFVSSVGIVSSLNRGTSTQLHRHPRCHDFDVRPQPAFGDGENLPSQETCLVAAVRTQGRTSCCEGVVRDPSAVAAVLRYADSLQQTRFSQPPQRR